MNEPITERYQLWDRFLERFPLERLNAMTLEEYTRVGSKDTFCWWIESGLDELGSIWGGSAFKFGIYERKNTETTYKSKQYAGDSRYAWLAKYGRTAAEAFSTVRSLVVEVAQASREGDLAAIDQVDLGAAYKWKIAFHYQDRSTPSSLNIFKKDVLGQFLQARGKTVPAGADYAQLYTQLMELRADRDLLEFGDLVWKEGSLLQSYSVLKKDFLKHYPGFTTFTNPTADYRREERDYKQELCSIFQEEIAPRLHPLPQDTVQRVLLGRDIAALFGRKLDSEDGKPQNLVGWRYWDFARELDDQGQAAFAQAVAGLTDPDIELERRIPVFIDFLRTHCSKEQFSPAATRSLVTFFLFLSDPGRHFFIKTGEINKLLKLFHLSTFKNDSLSPVEYSRVRHLAVELYNLLEGDGLEPRDMIDVQSFAWSALQPRKEENDDSDAGTAQTREPEQEMSLMTKSPLNQILYGPPGTGKTYRTATLAVRICDDSVPDDRAKLMQRYRELIADKRISFVSFHQSFSYEEFIEGIRPELAGQMESEQEQLIYKVEDGLFKKICAMARAAMDDLQRPEATGIDLTGRKFYKMSVGGKNDPDVESYCFENGYLALGKGGDVDFSVLSKEKKWEPARDAIKKLMLEKGSEDVGKRFAVQAMYFFKNSLDIGDIVVVARGVTQMQAIGLVTGEYEYNPDRLPGLGYEHFRQVQWLIKDAAIPVEKILSKQFSQQTIYTLNPAYLNMKYFEKLLGGREIKGEAAAEAEHYVLIIDEINRANISKVLGELITLLELDKRLGALNEVTVKLPYSREEFGIPANLHIVGTMNTADRSLALLDTALRRRFEFVEMMPDYDLLQGVQVEEIQVDKLLQTINQRIEALYDREHTLGHAFFMGLKQDASMENLASIFANKIIPLLAEYFFEDWQKIRLVLGDNQKKGRPEIQFIHEGVLEQNGSVLFGNSTDLSMYGLDRVRQYIRNDEALTDPDTYLGIYEPVNKEEE
jgi:5-methylcytosine-specific restriction endonuclease McrBC GTP-binding regulatory subunit McrB